MCACLASGGYCGSTLWVSNPCDTPCETRTRLSSTFGTATGELSTPPRTPPTCPPATPPGTPPTTPPIAGGVLDGGAAEAISCVFTICFGILVGVRSSLGSSCAFTTGCACAVAGAAAGGGGGGGGGGAANAVTSCLAGSASTKINGISTRKLTIAIWMMNDRAVAFPRLVLILLLDSIRLSSNTGPSPFRVQSACWQGVCKIRYS